MAMEHVGPPLSRLFDVIAKRQLNIRDKLNVLASMAELPFGRQSIERDDPFSRTTHQPLHSLG